MFESMAITVLATQTQLVCIHTLRHCCVGSWSVIHALDQSIPNGSRPKSNMLVSTLVHFSLHPEPMYVSACHRCKHKIAEVPRWISSSKVCSYCGNTTRHKLICSYFVSQVEIVRTLLSEVCTFSIHLIHVSLTLVCGATGSRHAVSRQCLPMSNS